MASVSKTVNIDKSKHGIIIGKGGANIKSLEAQHHVKIVLTDTVTVNGPTQHQVDDAVKAINDLFLGDHRKAPADKISKVLTIPADDHKFIVGPSGATVKSIRDESGADVQIAVPSADCVTIVGADEKSVKVAEKLVLAAVSKVHDQHENTDAWYQKYQLAIDEHAKKRADYFEQAKKAHDANNGALAKELSEKGKAETLLMEKAQEKAAHAVFEHRNKDNGRDVIDLHGLQVEGAVMLTTKFLDEHAKSKAKELTIITGKGLHSDAAGPKILPAIEKLLSDRKLKHEAVPGGFKVTL